MEPFGKAKIWCPEEISVMFEEDNEGYTNVFINGIYYGKAKSDGYMIVNGSLPFHMRVEALLALTVVMSKIKNKQEISRLVAGYRNDPNK